MAIQIQLRQGTTTEHNTFTGAVGEVTVDTTKDVPVVHDGDTVGGHPVAARANADGTISLIKKDGTSAGTINALGLFNNTLTSTNTNQALTAAQGKALKNTLDTAFGISQSIADVTSSRLFNTTYVNSTSRTIFITVQNRPQSADQGAYMTIEVNGLVVAGMSGSSGFYATSSMSAPVPSGSSYKIGGTNIGIQRVVEYS